MPDFKGKREGKRNVRRKVEKKRPTNKENLTTIQVNNKQNRAYQSSRPESLTFYLVAFL